MANSDSISTASSKSINPPEWGVSEWDAMSQDEFADNLLEKMKGEEAVLTCEQMDIIEKFWDEDRRTRRAALAMLTKPYAWLEDKIQNDKEFAEAMVELLECVETDKYSCIANLLLDAQRRLICAISCREDLDELHVKVKAKRANQ